MNWQALIVNTFENLSMVLGRVLDGLTQEALNHQPAPDSNSIGWLVWHILRGQDLGIAGLMGEEQLWIKDGWQAKINRPPEPMEFGLGYTPEDLAAFESPDVKTLLDYHQAVLDQPKRYLNNLSESELGRKVDHPVFPTIGIRNAGHS